MLRSVFLSYSPDHFFTLVQGSLQLLDVSSLPPPDQRLGGQVDDLTIESWIISSAINASPDSMNLIPDRIAVIDLGNFILIRAGMDVDDTGERALIILWSSVIIFERLLALLFGYTLTNSTCVMYVV
jgi:hypothetical protein